MKFGRVFGSTLLALSLVAGAASAAPTEVSNNDYKVSIARPDGWADVEGNDRAVFNFKHDASHTQLEVIGTQLMTGDVSNVFFDTFHETLASSEFTRTGREEKKYNNIEGTETMYSFSHSGVNMKVVVFQFVHETTAYVAVAYVQQEQFDAMLPVYQAAVSSMKFGE